MNRIAMAVALLALSASTLAQNAPQFQERIDVNAVLLDVIVTDSRGNQILGLGPDDFVVKENGVVQPVESVDYFTNRRLLDQREDQAPFKVERVKEDRYFVFFFDKPSAPFAMNDQMALARHSVKTFLREEMKDTDFVAIAGHDVRLKIYSDFTSDRAQLERALSDVARFGKGVTRAAEGTGPSILRGIDADAMMNHTGTVYQALDVLAEAVRPIRARKNVVLFSPGIADREEAMFGGMLSSRSRYLDPALHSLNTSNVSVYGVQLQRNADPTPIFHQRLEEISDSTGGHYFRLNVSFIPALQEIERTNNGYYLLSYKSNATDRGYQKVEVRAKNREFRVVSRSGYELGG